MFIFFFKQKTAYEMRISDWSSDVCSSDLQGRFRPPCDLTAHKRRATVACAQERRMAWIVPTTPSWYLRCTPRSLPSELLWSHDPSPSPWLSLLPCEPTGLLRAPATR